ncbi:30S ribosomal protein S4 [Candidatus Dependentiae bacterium]|nr:30S ribosomal protein S4 [Candidatus Dependentiae bacterium]
MTKKSVSTAPQSSKRTHAQQKEESSKPTRKMSEYGKQLYEKQKVKEMYGMREKQFRRFFSIAARKKGATGETLLSLLERRLDNVVFRLKLATTRAQARQVISHGHVNVNGKKVHTASYLVEVNDIVSLKPAVFDKQVFVNQVINKRLATAAKVPEWLELNKAEYKGQVLRYPVRSDIQAPIEEHLIVELYSK